jgi:hypothetical protein
LKRFEQPPPDYAENFLEEFRDRQRSQLLREPAWRIAWDRMCAFFGEQMPARLGYGVASLAVLAAAGVASLNILAARPVVDQIASLPEAPHPVTQTASLNLNPAVELPELPPMAHTASFSIPRYVMDARPVSYDPQSSF